MVYAAGNTAQAKWMLLNEGWLPNFTRLKKGYSLLLEAGLVSYTETPIDPNLGFIPSATFAYINPKQHLNLTLRSYWTLN